jgi:hypothetical protein
MCTPMAEKGVTTGGSPLDGIERAIRRARRHLADDEGIVATAPGLEADGRRRQVVLLTDRRLLVVAVRGGAPLELDPDGTRTSFDTVGKLLTLVDGEDEVVLRNVDLRAGRQLLALLALRRPPGIDRDRPGTVRIVG